MKTLALYYNEDQRLEVTDSLGDLNGLIPSMSVLLFDNAFEINKFLFKHTRQIQNPDYLKKELDEYRKEEPFYSRIDKAIEEEGVIKLRHYFEDEALS